jgi:hypothetical protein
MGAWSHEPFGNDTASDWAYGLDDARDLRLIQGAVNAVVEGEDGYLDASIAEEAVAAAEVIAHLLGRGTQHDSYTERVQAWASSISAKPNPELRRKARQALQRILSEDSELRELWQESDEYAAWEGSIKALQYAIDA